MEREIPHMTIIWLFAFIGVTLWLVRTIGDVMSDFERHTQSQIKQDNGEE